MFTLRSDWPSMPEFHPEFGYLCPSPRRRRSLRLGMAAVIAAIAIGATIELAVAYWRHSDVATSPAVRSMDEGRGAEGTAVPTIADVGSVSARPSAAASDTGGLPLARPHWFCKEPGANDFVAAFLNPTCGPAKTHARHLARTNYRIATVILGRTGSLPAPAATEPRSVDVPSHAAGGVTGTTTASTMQPIEPATRLAKKPKGALGASTVSTPATRRPAQQVVDSFALAPMPGPPRDYHSAVGVARAAVLPPSFGGPFGRIW